MRLDEICALIPKVGIFADIGCDHGLLCKMVLDAHLAERIIAADISPVCLEKAKVLLKDEAEYYVGDGLEPLKDIIPDVTVISGMGGNTILHILDNRILPQVIISPQNDVYKVRKELTERYTIVEDKLVCERGKYYDIIKLVPGRMELDEFQLTYGTFFDKGDRILREKLKRDREKLITYKQTQLNKYKLQLIAKVEDIIDQRA